MQSTSTTNLVNGARKATETDGERLLSVNYIGPAGIVLTGGGIGGQIKSSYYPPVFEQAARVTHSGSLLY